MKNTPLRTVRRLYRRASKFVSTLSLRSAFLLIGGIGFVVAGIFVIWAATLSLPDLAAFDESRLDGAAKFYDRTGEILLFDMNRDIRRTLVPGSAVAESTKNAIIAIEDPDFYSHQGISIRSIMRAVLVNIVQLDPTAQGGSTITQQAVKNALLTQEQTIARKIKEAILAIRIEQERTKDQIIELYLNVTPYGGNVYGIEEASRMFFEKSAKDVTLAESAYLAAIPQAPTFYSPYGKNREALEDRKKLVLQKMEEYGFITAAERAAAESEVVVFAPPKPSTSLAPHFVFYIQQQLVEEFGEDALTKGSFSVTTTIDARLQSKAQDTLKEYGEKNEVDFNASNAALVAIDPTNGHILTMVGSRNYGDFAIDGAFNVATAERQPGSAFKPFVYAEAWERGYTTETVLFDLPTQFSTNCEPGDTSSGGDCYAPNNYDNAFVGPMTMRAALGQSRNIPAVQTLYLVGIKNAINRARTMGITTLTNSDQYGLTLVLGGGEVKLLDMVAAYSVFANEGTHFDPVGIIKVVDGSGKVIKESKDPVGQAALSPETARMMNNVLSDRGARAGLFATDPAPAGVQLALKTGTTNDYRDAWVVGYTPNIVIGAWAGNNDNSPMDKKVSGLIVVPMWGVVMREGIAIMGSDSFNSPPGIPDSLPPIMRGNWKGGESYFIDSISGKLATEFTPPETREEVVVGNVHSILYWVSRDNPRGGRPLNPAGDPQYRYWEYAVDAWKRSEGIVDQESFTPPTEKDDVHLPEYRPSATFVAPFPETITSGSPLIAELSISATRNPIKDIVVEVNGEAVGTFAGREGVVRITIPWIKISELQSPLEVSVIVRDVVYNRTTLNQVVNVR